MNDDGVIMVVVTRDDTLIKYEVLNPDTMRPLYTFWLGASMSRDMALHILDLLDEDAP